jgi:hypothetical protein
LALGLSCGEAQLLALLGVSGSESSLRNQIP